MDDKMFFADKPPELEDRARMQAYMIEVRAALSTGGVQALVDWVLPKLTNKEDTPYVRYLALSVACRFGMAAVPPVTLLADFMSKVGPYVTSQPLADIPTYMTIFERTATALCQQNIDMAMRKNREISMLFGCDLHMTTMPGSGGQVDSDLGPIQAPQKSTLH